MSHDPPLTAFQDDAFWAGAGKLSALLRSIDWGATPLGALARWPQSLRTTMSICLNSRFPIAVYWGADFLMLYNEALIPMVGAKKHPRALGQSARVVLAEIWTIIEPLLERVRTTAEATWSEDLMLPLARTGAPEESYFTFTYSPIRDETQGVGGVFCAAVETTDKVIEGRRLRLLNELAEAARAETPLLACQRAAEKLAAATADVPFALLYLIDDVGDANLVSAASIAAGSALAPVRIRAEESGMWPFERATHAPQFIPITDGPGGARGALILPIAHSGEDRLFGFAVVGLSPMLSNTESYKRFHTLLGVSISQSVNSAAAYERERERAEALAALDRAKTAFFSNVSHEFRTPLTLILGPTEDALAASNALSNDERERWTIVQRSALRLNKLVNTLLEFSRIEAGRIEASYEPTDLAALTRELASMFRSAIDRAGLDLRLEIAECLEPAYVDREMWEKIVLHLLSNALKFTFCGRITVRLSAVDDGFELAVTDTGIGIAPADLAHIFERFHRIKGARSRTHEGTGIGLALVSEFVKLHRGTVGVKSEEGRGTTFRVTVPRGCSHLPTERLGAARRLTSTSTGAAPYVEEALRWSLSPESIAPRSMLAGTAVETGPRARILLADDNSDMRDYVRRLLQERWNVVAVPDGHEALAAMQSQPPDLVVTDVMMPGVDGLGLLRAIRSNPRLRLVPVILLSARAGEDETAEGLGAGANDYIVKPFSARELLVRVASALAFRRASREAQAIEDAARQRLYRHFIQAPFPVAVLRGVDHTLELANQAALQAWGKDGSIMGKPIREAMPELVGQPFLGYLREVLRSGASYSARGELARLVRSHGTLEEVYFDFVYAPLLESDGSVDGVLVCGFEVTAQVRAAQETAHLLSRAEAGERQFRQVVENLPELAWTARADGGIDYYNQRWYEYTGIEAGENYEWGWTTLLVPEKADAILEHWRRCIDAGSPFETDIQLRDRDGHYRWFLSRVRPLRDADGRIVRWFGSNTDIDERRRADDFRELFVGILGHDLRNPLSTILTTSHLLSMREDTPAEIKKRLDRVTVSGVRIQRMIDQLLDLTRARLTDGIPLELTSAPFVLAPLVKKIVDEVSTAQPRAKIVLRVEGDCSARVDPDRFEQVVSNLLGNAVKHGDLDHHIDVVLSQGGDVVRMTVQNQGPAIDAAFLPLLFNPFARAGKARGPSEGLGLGLYISERIVAAHRGKISVESSSEMGTRFEVVLPRLG